MRYHIRVSQKSNKAHDEVKLDLDEEQLRKRYVGPYESGEPIIINGKTVLIEDLERIKISKSTEPASALMKLIRSEDQKSSVLVFGGPSDEWRAADRAADVTDEFITGPPGGAKRSKHIKKRGKQSEKKVSGSGKKVFIVHGHDHALKSDLEVFCRDLGLDPIVLHRKADEGLTVIEKFEQHSDVQYAFVLLTPDDMGYPVAESRKAEKDRKVASRARQNVIFEFGYFVGRLGREKVCCVYKAGVEIPSDLAGLIYKKVTDSIEEVGYSIIRELKAANVEVEIS